MQHHPFKRFFHANSYKAVFPAAYIAVFAILRVRFGYSKQFVDCLLAPRKVGAN